ncbi:MAG: type II secretion system F family protein [Candidatus Omnitrophica bacterium]|nr:type II secretion system F family protein [Candidatus Omnitrophota bacterium]
MPKYFYFARDKAGIKVSGVEDANTQEEVVNRLQARGLTVVGILTEEQQQISTALNLNISSKIKFRPKHGRVTSSDLTLFCRQLATLLGAGVTILRSLNVISQQVNSRRLYETIKLLEKNMEAGLSFHEAMGKFPKVFPELWVNLAESGEASGNLPIVLSRLASYLEQTEAFRSKIISALIYPAILLLVGTGALFFLTVKIIPTFIELFKGFNIELPLLTKMLFSFSSFVRGYFLIIIGVLIVCFFAFRKYISTRDGRKQFEQFLFKAPVVGEFFRVIAIERFTSEMSTLIESGVPILYSLEIAERSVGSVILSEIVAGVKNDVREGKTLSQPLEKSGFFDPMVVQMVAIGEEIGDLSNMFKRLNNYYQEYINTFLTRFTAMFEPVMLVFMGIVVGIMVIGMFLPIFQLTQIK